MIIKSLKRVFFFFLALRGIYPEERQDKSIEMLVVVADDPAEAAV